MISRCYNPQDISYEFYGAKGVKVCDRWLEFCNFFDDVKDIPGYDRELFNARLLRLDKDMRSGETKIYSPETVTLISDYQNQMIRTAEYNNIHVKYAVFPDGHIEKITNLSEFCKTHSIHRQNANLCLSGKQRSTKGFRFYRE